MDNTQYTIHNTQRLLFALLFVIVLLMTACENFNKPLVPFIDFNTNSVRVLEEYVQFVTPYYNNTTAGFVAIPPGEETIINLPLYNPLDFDLELALSGLMEGYAEAELGEDNLNVTIKIKNPERLNEFDMTLDMSNLVKSMVPYQIPKMQARYLDNSLHNFSIKLSEEDTHNIHLQRDVNSFSASVNEDIPHVYVSFEVHEYATYTINNEPRLGRSHGELVPVASVIPITVTADSGEVAAYEILISVEPIIDEPIIDDPIIDDPVEGSGVFDIKFADLTEDGEPEITPSNVTISRKAAGTLKVSMTTAVGFTDYKWYVNGYHLEDETENSIVIQALDYKEGMHIITLTVKREISGIVYGYSAEISFTVAE